MSLRIVVLMHEQDISLFGQYRQNVYLINSLVLDWQAAGHEVIVAYGLNDLPDADVAVLHVDLSVIPHEYVHAIASYPIVVNGKALDIRKSRVSCNLLQPGDAWPGSVIVKTDLNFGGLPERLRHVSVPAMYEENGFAVGDNYLPSYIVYPTLADVPKPVFADRRLVVERFLPEREGDLYALRTWIFLGDRGYCRRFVSDSAIIRGTEDEFDSYVDVPKEIQDERQRLGFDFGKFDFVVHDDVSYLLDANRTPSAPQSIGGWAATVPFAAADLSHGLEAIVRSHSGSLGVRTQPQLVQT